MAMINWHHVKYFESYEFDDPNYPGSGELIDGQLVMMLDKMRRAIRPNNDWPIIIHRGGGVDVDGTHGHAPRSYHRADMGAKAVDWHFRTSASIEFQVRTVMQFGFAGTGIYYCWGIPVGFHTDTRPVDQYQVWTCRERGKYIYLI